MSLRILTDLVQGTDEWMEARRGMVTASVVGQLVTVRTKTGLEFGCPKCKTKAGDPCLSIRNGIAGGDSIKTLHPERTASAAASGETVIEPAKTDRTLVALLAAERITGYTEPTYVSDDMMRGWMDEEKARAKYAEHMGVEVDNTVGLMVRDDSGHEIGFSPDGLVGEDGLIEIKSRRQKKHLLTVVADEVPPENMAQIQCGLLVSGRAWCDYISYSGGMAFWPKRVFPDERWFAAIEAAVRQFERTADAMTTTYLTRTVGLPMTERVTDLEMTF